MNFAELKKLRKKHKLNQEQFAARVGCVQEQISVWERGKVQLSDKRLAGFYKIFENDNIK